MCLKTQVMIMMKGDFKCHSAVVDDSTHNELSALMLPEYSPWN